MGGIALRIISPIPLSIYLVMQLAAKPLNELLSSSSCLSLLNFADKEFLNSLLTIQHSSIPFCLVYIYIYTTCF